jgi:hypothetical protein
VVGAWGSELKKRREGRREGRAEAEAGASDGEESDRERAKVEKQAEDVWGSKPVEVEVSKEEEFEQYFLDMFL